MNNLQSVDVLTDVLSVGDLGSRIICRPELSAPWGLIFTPENKSYFHIIKRGVCYFYHEENRNSLVLHQGDVLFIPKVYNYRIVSSKNVKGRYYKDEISYAEKKSTKVKGETAALICGSYQLSSNMSLPLFSLLPNYIHLTSDDINRFPELNQILQIILREDSLTDLGRDLVISRMLDVLLVQIIRIWLKCCESESASWLSATQQKEISGVLSIIHNRPDERWTIDSLAKEVAISRTKLFNKFTEVVGITPIQYLTNWRIDLSKRLLLTTLSPIIEVANAVGYESEASFGRAFKKFEGLSPGKYRKLN